MWCVQVPQAALFVVVLATCAVVGAKECVFLHGSGESDFGPPTSTFPGYWGDVHKYTTQCTNHTFNHANTIDYPFDDPILMKAYCEAAGNGSSVISNKIVFTHSMGNNIFAAAIRAGICDLDESSTWYEVSGPMYGSKAISYAIEYICNASSIIKEPLKWLADELSYCKDGRPTPAYLSLDPSNPSLKGLADVMQSRISGALCGLSAWGITSRYSVALDALAEIVQYGEPNDGMVGMSSCEVQSSLFQNSTSSAFFQGAFNHADTTCRNGEDPCEWYGYQK